MVILKRVIKVSLLEELLLEQRVKRGGKVSFADMGGRVVQLEKVAGVTPSDEAASLFRNTARRPCGGNGRRKEESNSHVEE